MKKFCLMLATGRQASLRPFGTSLRESVRAFCARSTVWIIIFAFFHSMESVSAVPPRTYSFRAPATAEIFASADYIEWSQQESVQLTYTGVQNDGRTVRWEILGDRILWLNEAPVTNTTTSWTWSLKPPLTGIPAGKYSGRIAVYDVQDQTNLVFHRVIALQEIRVIAQPRPDIEWPPPLALRLDDMQSDIDDIFHTVENITNSLSIVWKQNTYPISSTADVYNVGTFLPFSTNNPEVGMTNCISFDGADILLKPANGGPFSGSVIVDRAPLKKKVVTNQSLETNYYEYVTTEHEHGIHSITGYLAGAGSNADGILMMHYDPSATDGRQGRAFVNLNTGTVGALMGVPFPQPYENHIIQWRGTAMRWTNEMRLAKVHATNQITISSEGGQPSVVFGQTNASIRVPLELYGGWSANSYDKDSGAWKIDVSGEWNPKDLSWTDEGALFMGINGAMVNQGEDPETSLYAGLVVQRSNGNPGLAYLNPYTATARAKVIWMHDITRATSEGASYKYIPDYIETTNYVFKMYQHDADASITRSIFDGTTDCMDNVKFYVDYEYYPNANSNDTTVQRFEVVFSDNADAVSGCKMFLLEIYVTKSSHDTGYAYGNLLWWIDY